LALTFSDGRHVDLEGLEYMADLLDGLGSQIPADLFETKKWFQA
jgi:hypothetical protein